MLHKVNQRVKDIQVPGIRVFANQVAQLPNGINLTIGEPDFPTPTRVKKAGINAINQNLTRYSHNAGLLNLREQVSSYFNQKYNFYYVPETEIVITNGASEGIDSVLRTILSDGDEVVLPAPIYSGYEPIIHLCGAKAVYLDTTKTNFLPDPKSLENILTDKTKAIILNYPSNPTGVTIHKDLMDELVCVLKKYDIFIISDEIYSENIYRNRHVSFASYPEIRDKLFLVHGLSKSHSMTGWRVGFVLGPNDLMQHVLKVHLSNSICASLPSQIAAVEALMHCREIPSEMNLAYMKRRDYVCNRLLEMGLSITKPNGAFYVFPSIESTGLTSFEFATRLLIEEHVAVVPGSAFTSYGEGFIRISYANSMDNLIEGMDRLGRFLENVDNAI